METNTPKTETADLTEKPLKNFKIDINLAFSGEIFISAESKSEAIRLFRENITSTCPNLIARLPVETFRIGSINGTPVKKACKITLI